MRNGINGSEARTGRASEKLGTRKAPLTNLWPASQVSSTTPLANLWVESQTNLLTPLTRFWQQAKAYQRNTFDTQFTGVHSWVKTAFSAFDLGGKGAFKDDLWCTSKVNKFVQRWPLQNLWPHIWCAVKAIFRAVNGLHLVQNFARIFVRGRHLFWSANRFPRA